MPEKEYYAAFVEVTVHHEGDERSRLYPGHGYPAHTTTHTEVVKFKDEEELKTWVLQNDSGYNPKSYTLVRCSPIKVTKTVSLSVT